MVEVSATPELSAHVALSADQVARATTKKMMLVGILATAARVRAVPASRWAYQDPNSSNPATLMKLADPLAELRTSRKDRTVNSTSPAVTSEMVTRLKATRMARATPIDGLIPATIPTTADMASSRLAHPAYSLRPGPNGALRTEARFRAAMGASVALTIGGALQAQRRFRRAQVVGPPTLDGRVVHRAA